KHGGKRRVAHWHGAFAYRPLASRWSAIAWSTCLRPLHLPLVGGRVTLEESGLPGVEHLNADIPKVLLVPRDQDKSFGQSGRSNEAIDTGQCFGEAGHHFRPFFSDIGVDAVGLKAVRIFQVMVNRQKSLLLLRIRETKDTFEHLSKCQNADVEIA